MSWLDKLVSKTEPGTTEVFNGRIGDAEKGLQDSLQGIMNYALNEPTGGGVREIGKAMIMQMNGCEALTKDGPKVIGDYEIIIRRVR